MRRACSLKIFTGTLLIGLLAFLAVACGGGGGDATATKPATRPATKAATAPATKTPATAPATAPTGTEEAEASATAPPPGTDPPAATNTPPSTGGTTLDVAMRDFAIEPSINRAPVGTVTFNIENLGALAHDFYVIRTDLAPDALPIDAAAFQVRTSELDVVKYQPALTAGQRVQVTVDLSADAYVLICNIASHYQAGSRVAFTVQ